MAERAEPTSVGTAASERDLLLATKLYLPHRQPGFVPRPRLVDMLDGARAGGLVLVCAPAGFGKTALLGDWARRGERQVAWLSLDAGDSDPARFWRHVVAALDRARPGIAGRVAPLLGPPAPPSFEALVTALINELAAEPVDRDVLLILDDYHLVDSAPVHDSLMFLLEHLPQELHLVLASRADPPLALARLRARGQLAELRAAQLRFTSEEAAALLREAAGADLPQDALEALEARTEGWAAGLQLAALSLRGQADVAGFVATFSGSHRYVLDYLTEEVLERQPEQMREFLLETSALERLSGELCDEVTGRADGQAMLEAIEAAGLFLVPLDDERGWWRYHHLFADLLRIRLQRQQPGRVAALHRAAATWHDEHGLADEAVRHALAADDPIWAARLMERHADALLFRSDGGTVQRWLAELPASLVQSRPRLLLVQAWMALISRRMEAAETAVNAAERAWKATPDDEPFEPAAGRAVSQLAANVTAGIALVRTDLAVLHGDAEQAATLGRRALAGLGDGESLLKCIAEGHLGRAEWLRGNLAEAERSRASFIAQGRALGGPTLVGWGCHELGQIQRAQGRLDAALSTYHQALEVAGAPSAPTPHATGIAHVGMAEVAYQRDDLELALHDVGEGIAACRPFKYAQPLANGLATLAWIRQATGDPAGAREAMDEAGRAAPGPSVTVLFNPVPAHRARLQIAQGDPAAAADWTQERGLSADDEPGYSREAEYLVLARLLLAQDRPTQALVLLGRLHGAAIAQGRVGSVIEIQALRALALAACGDNAAAVDALAEALTLGRPQGYVRVFADEGAAMRALLGRLIAAQRSEQVPARAVPLDYLAQLLRAFDGQHGEPGPGSAASAAPGLVEQLTTRELEVLALLAAGKSNARIADELVVTVDTVKKHVSHILDKLGADNRTEAVTRGRQLGLIS